MTKQDGSYKPCGIITNGVRCETLIAPWRSSCESCANALLSHLEKMADEPIRNLGSTQVRQKASA